MCVVDGHYVPFIQATRCNASARDPWMKLNLRTSTIFEDLGSIKSTLVQRLVPVVELSGLSLR